MPQTTLTADIVAKEALAILENELGVISKMHRAHEEEFSQKVNGYKVGDEIRIRRPADFTVRTGPTMNVQDVIEGKVTLKVDQQIGVDFNFSSTDLTLKIDDLSERVMKPAMTSIINHMSNDVLTTMYKGVYNWVGVSGTAIDSFADFSKGPERLDEMAVPQDNRYAVLSPADYWAFVGSQTALYAPGLVNEAYRKGHLGPVGNVDTYMSQVTPTHSTGTRDDTTPLTDGDASVNVKSYNDVKDTWTQTLVTDGWDSQATLKAGDVFTIADCYMVNPRTKASTGILQQFVVQSDVTADATTSNDTNITISPPIIQSGPHQTVTGYADGKAIVQVGAASSSFRQNMIFHKNTMALAVVPMEMPVAAVGGARRSYKGFSVRVIPVYDGTNDISKWRLDLLYGRRCIDPRLAVRLSATGA